MAWEEAPKPEVDAGRFVTHRFALDEFDKAYDVSPGQPTPERSRSS
jgi:hypothetical protein